MDNTQIELEISKLQKKITKLSKNLYGQKPEVKQKRFNEITMYQSQIEELQKQINNSVNLYEKDYIKHVVPIKSNIEVEIEDDGDGATAILKSTENEIINKPINSISGTEVLFMDDDSRLREKDYQTTMKNTIMKNINQSTEPVKIHELTEKLEIVNTNLSKLNAAIK